MSPTLRRAIAFWLPAAVAMTITAGLVYGAVQQDYRTGANDPQLQLAEDAAARLSAGLRPEDAIAGANVNIATSLAPFTIAYDDGGTVLASTGTLDGAVPKPPPGVLQAARDRGSNTITWQPRDGVREAIVVVPWSDANGGSGTVLAGRSLRAVEERENRLTLMVGAAWIVALVAAAGAALVGARLWGSPQPDAGDGGAAAA